MYANDEEKELFATASSKTKYLAVKRDGKLYSYTQYIRIIDYEGECLLKYHTNYILVLWDMNTFFTNADEVHEIQRKRQMFEVSYKMSSIFR